MADQPCAERGGDFLKPEIILSKRNYAIGCKVGYLLKKTTKKIQKPSFFKLICMTLELYHKKNF